MNEYDDIIGLSHPDPKKHKRMAMENRAAQFAPFAALNGHEEALAETARLTSSHIELSDYEKYALSRRLHKALLTQRPIEIVYFIPDCLKQGGAYVTLQGLVMEIDEYERTLRVSTGESIPLHHLHSIRFI